MPVADDAVTETELEGAVPSPLVFDVMREVKSPVDRALEGTPDACKVVLPKSSSAGDQRFPVQVGWTLLGCDGAHVCAIECAIVRANLAPSGERPRALRRKMMITSLSKETSRNQFDVLSGLDSDNLGDLISASSDRNRVLPSSERTPEHVFLDSATLRLELLMMIRDQPLDLRMANLENRIRRLKGLSPIKIKEYAIEKNGCFANHGEESILKNPLVGKNAVATENQNPRKTMLGEVSAEDIAVVGEAAIEATNGGADDASEDNDASVSSEDAEVVPNNKDPTELPVAEVSMPLGDEVLDGMSEPNLPTSGIDIAGCSGDSMVGKNRIQNREHGDPLVHLDEGPVKKKPGITNVLAAAVQAEGSKVLQIVASKLPQSWAKVVANDGFASQDCCWNLVPAAVLDAEPVVLVLIWLGCLLK
ncbi:hypothetical protein U1Q18_040481 [Sarracenia purpurea var. burkii]